MESTKTGTSMSGIVVTKKAIDKKQIEFKKSTARTRRANICLKCRSNKEGYCTKHKGWCGRVNYKCLNIEDPYLKKPKKKKHIKHKSNYQVLRKEQKKFDKLMDKYLANPEKVVKQLKKKYKIE